MKNWSLVSVLLLLALLAGVVTTGALSPRELPTAAQAATAVIETPTVAPADATQANATPLPELLTPASTGPTLGGTSWIMSSLNGALPDPDTTVTLQLGADGSASGSDGCNRYWTTFEQDGQNLTFKQPMAGTMMACEKPVMAQAAEYRETLATVTGFLRSARQLVLFAGDDIVLTYIADDRHAGRHVMGRGQLQQRPGGGRRAARRDGDHAELRRNRPERQRRVQQLLRRLRGEGAAISSSTRRARR